MRIMLRVRYGREETDIEFPSDERVLCGLLEKIGAPLASKLYISEVVQPREFVMLENMTLDPDEINYLAKLMDSEMPDELHKMYAVAAYEGFDTPKELINLHYNLNCYTLIQDVKDMAAVGRKYLLTLRGGIPTSELKKTDCAKIGRKLLASRKGVFTDYGLLFRNEDVEFREVYDGKTFPCYSYSGKELFCVDVSFQGRHEYLYLPEEPISITKALHRLGAENSTECTYRTEYSNIDNKDWMQRFDRMLQEENIFDVNRFTDAIDRADMDLKKLTALVKYIGDGSADVIAKLAEHIGEFEYISDAENYETVGQCVLENELGAIPLEANDYFDYEGYGKYIADAYAGKFIEGGFVYSYDPDFLHDLVNDPGMGGQK